MRYYFFWIALLLIFIYLLQVLFPQITDFFILNDRAVENLEFWRYVTALFLHGSIEHLMFNLFALLLFGFMLEKLIGSSAFLQIYLFSGIIGNLIALNFYNSSLGASGAIYGVIGALTVLQPLMMVWAFGMIIPLFIASLLWVTADIFRILGIFGETNIG